MKSGLFLLIALSLGLVSGCKKFVEVDSPSTEISGGAVYSSNSSAAAVMAGVYSNMMSGQSLLSDGNRSIGFLQGLAADELTNFNTDPTQTQFYQNALSSSSNGSTNYYYWQEIYSELHVVNAVLEGLAGSKGVTPGMKQQLTGEAKFMRAFFHFYAVNLYGDVPLITTTNYLTNNQIGRSPKDLVYQQIIQDLKDAQEDLSDNYQDAAGNPTTDRIRPNKATATALLARVYLYQKKWADAAVQASAVIANTNYSLNSDLMQVFQSVSAETIWQLVPVSAASSTYDTYDAFFFVLTADPGVGQYSVAMSPNLVNAFENGDQRLVNWVGSFTASTGQIYYYPFKYKVYLSGDPATEDKIVFRLAEQYLIRAEAEANGAGNGIGDAINDLNMIRNRAGLPGYNGPVSRDAVLSAILHERQVELFTEWGHRWFDLARTGNLNPVMGSPGDVCAAKGGTWNPDWALLPLPLSDLQIDSKLTQNPGY